VVYKELFSEEFQWQRLFNTIVWRISKANEDIFLRLQTGNYIFVEYPFTNGWKT